MRMVDIITKKRNGRQLDPAEIARLVQAYTEDSIPDYQMAAFLMAIYFQDMTDEETAALTLAMAHSGKMVDLSVVPGIKVDKHSTGGVADTTTLILAPLVAAAGVPVAKMSGRGLGFTGGTIDKLESIPGFSTSLSETDFIANVKQYGVAVIGQTKDIAPADGKLYALRDVTATVESIPLIASSIMSKKIAAGADKILLDVKVGSGAFMKNLDDAVKLAAAMVRIGTLVNRATLAVITSMDEPLGTAIGNSLEVEEAIDVLKGDTGTQHLRDVCLTLGAHMLVMAGSVADVAAGRTVLAELLQNGKALAKLKELIAAQGGNPAVIEDRSLFPQAMQQVVVRSKNNGYVQRINAAAIGSCATLLGAGREHKLQSIDLSAGLIMHCRTGDFVRRDQPLATVYTNDAARIPEVTARLYDSIGLGFEPAEQMPLILGFVDENGFHKAD